MNRPVSTMPSAPPSDNASGSIDQLRTFYQSHQLRSLIPLLPLLRLKGEPYTINNYAPLEPLFKLEQPRRTYWKCGRKVAKTTSMAAQAVLQSAATPYFETLFIAPRYEQVRRISSNFVKPFIEQSVIRDQLQGKGTEDTVLQKTFRNGARIYFSFAFLDPDRTRGLVSDSIRWDESICCCSISTPTGNKVLDELKVGDQVLAVDSDCRLTQDRVCRKTSHGVKHTWKLKLVDGRTLSCTEGELLFTDRGWMYASDILRLLSGTDGIATTDGFGYPARRRVSPQQKQVSALQGKSRPVISSLLSAQIRSAEDLCQNTSPTDPEQRLEHHQYPVRYVNHTGLRLCAQPVLCEARPEMEETGIPGMAGRANPGGNSLLVSGRRLTRGQPYHFPHGGLHPERSQKTGCCVENPRHTGTNRQKTKERQNVLDHQTTSRGCENPAETNTPVRSDLYVVQARRSFLDPTDIHVRLLRYPLPGEQTGLEKTSVLPGNCMPGKGNTGNKTTLSAETSSGKKQANTPEVLGEPRGKSSLQSRGCPTRTGRPCKEGAHQQATPGPPSTSKRRPGVRIEAETRTSALLPAIKARSCPLPTKTAVATHTAYAEQCLDKRARFVELLEISYNGRQEVWDIETEKHHTLFANGFLVHNCQDLDFTFLPVIRETMAASQYGIEMFFGTPKTLDNTLQVLWEKSSQAEWITRCEACSRNNIPTLDHHLLKMIGPMGPICVHCGRLINPREGRWVHAVPDSYNSDAGYHIPQIVLPMHYEDPEKPGQMPVEPSEKWIDLLHKRDRDYGTARFLNEVLGESCDVGQKLISLADIRNASVLNKNEWRSALDQVSQYHFRAMGVDWGGGGELGVSTTTIAVVGLNVRTGKTECIYTTRLNMAYDSAQEASECLKIFKAFQCHVFCHDYGGAGAIREMLILQAGLPLGKIVPFVYIRATVKKMVEVKKPRGFQQRIYYTLDKARSLVLLAQCIKSRQVLLPEFKSSEDITRDLLALIEDRQETRGRADIFLVTSSAKQTDDFAHALNYACIGAWHINNRYPDLSLVEKIKLTAEQMRFVEPPTPGIR